MLFLETDFNENTTELTGSQRGDCRFGFYFNLDLSKITVVAVRQCFHISVKPSRLVKVSMILLAARLNELKSPKNKNKSRVVLILSKFSRPRTPHYYELEIL